MFVPMREGDADRSIEPLGRPCPPGPTLREGDWDAVSYGRLLPPPPWTGMLSLLLIMLGALLLLLPVLAKAG
jgi:hypothetical protein